MKILTSTLTLFLVSLMALGQSTYRRLPLVKANSTSAYSIIDDNKQKMGWTICPQIKRDTLYVNCFTGNETISFYTDIDSIKYKITPNSVKKFYVSVQDTAYALTVIKGRKLNSCVLRFNKKDKNDSIRFWYEQNKDNAYLDLLRSKYPIDSIVEGAKSDTEKSLKILKWVNSRWQHDGSNLPDKSDAISILDEARNGRNFRCVEYGIVATSCLNAVGLKARVLGLKTQDVETTQYGAGHVLLEVFLTDLNKWVLLDGQWDAMPVLNNIPLNAVEFQKAIVENYEALEIKSSSTLPKRNYVEWIYPYLYYFDVSFDNREGINTSGNTIKGKVSLMLVPSNAKEPTIFQITKTIDNCMYTNSLQNFYAAPTNNK